jgi:hypothetical protein
MKMMTAMYVKTFGQLQRTMLLLVTEVMYYGQTAKTWNKRNPQIRGTKYNIL